MHHLPKDCCRYPSKCQLHCSTAAASTGGRYIMLQNLIRNSWGKGTKSPRYWPALQTSKIPAWSTSRVCTSTIYNPQNPHLRTSWESLVGPTAQGRQMPWQALVLAYTGKNLKYFYVVSFTHLTSQNSLTENRWVQKCKHQSALWKFQNVKGWKRYSLKIDFNVSQYLLHLITWDSKKGQYYQCMDRQGYKKNSWIYADLRNPSIACGLNTVHDLEWMCSQWANQLVMLEVMVSKLIPWAAREIWILFHFHSTMTVSPGSQSRIIKQHHCKRSISSQ